MAVVIRYETATTARWALPFIVGASLNDTITVAVWTGFHVPYAHVTTPRHGRHDANGSVIRSRSLIRL
ncbi:MAG: hypothetical protein WB691_14000 [Pseudolabrys sp.]|jgi:hypothetical protein